jgi:NAD(P)H dehydrogenase (quinone)
VPEPAPTLSGSGPAGPTTLVTIVYHSQFRGATRALAEAFARGARQTEGADVELVRCEDVDEHWQRLHDSHAIVFASPTYVGSVSAVFKGFIEKLAGDVFLDRLWTNKVGAGLTVSSGRSGDKLNALMDMVIFAGQMGMIWVSVPVTGGNYSSAGSEEDLNRMGGYLGVMAQANIDEPAELAPPAADLRTAELHGRHVSAVARALALGAGAVTWPVPTGVPKSTGVPWRLLTLPTGDIPAQVTASLDPGVGPAADS